MAENEFKIIISDAALSMLDSQANFLANASQPAALYIMNEILNDIESLRFYPQRYPKYQNQFVTDSKYHRKISAKRYLIIYEISAENVYIDYIVDCRQDYGRLICD